MKSNLSYKIVVLFLGIKISGLRIKVMLNQSFIIVEKIFIQCYLLMLFINNNILVFEDYIKQKIFI